MSAMLSCSVVKFTIFNAALSISVTSDNVTEPSKLTSPKGDSSGFVSDESFNV